MTTPILGLSEIAEGVSSQASLHNTALRQFEARTVRVLSKSTTAPPGSPAESDSYIIPTGSPVSWAGTANQIASYIGGAWSYFTPLEGVSVWVNDINATYTYDGAAWVAGSASGTVTSVALTVPAELSVSGSPITTAGTLAVTKATQSANVVWAGPTSGGAAQPAFRALVAADIPAQPFDLMAFYPGVPTSSVIVTRVPVARVITFPSSLTGSYAKARVAATAQTDFDVQKNGVSAATIRFAVAGTVATFIAASPIVTAAGDLISIHAPASADATIADIGFCLAGTR